MALTKIGSVGIATGISLAGVTTTQDAKVGTGITLSPDGHGYYTGIITATSYRGDVSNCIGVGQTNFIDAESLNVSGITTVGTGITLSPDGDVYATGVSTFVKDVNVVADLNIADYIVHTGDLDTKFGFSAADTVSVETAGASRFKIDSSGNLTIGNDGDSGSGPSAGYDELCIEGGNENIGMCFLSPAANNVTQQISFGDSNNNQVGRVVYNHANDYMSLHANNGERLRLDSSGRLLVNTTDIESVSSGEVSKVIVKGTDSTASAMFVRHSANNQGTGIYFGKSRNAAVGSNTVVQSGDELGRITFSGDDGTDINTMGAKIASYVDGTPGSNDMPGRLVFYTTADGANTVTERLRIDSSGRLHTGYTSGFGSDQINILSSDGGGVSVAQQNVGNAGAGTTIGSYSFQGYHSGGQTFASAEARISAIAAATHSGSSAATDLAFYTKPAATGPGSSPTEALRIDSNGNTNIVGVCTAAAFSTSAGQLSHRNIISNGAMRIAQRGTSSGSSGFKAMDRFRMSAGNASHALTQSQTAITSGAPYDEGFRYVFKILNNGQDAHTSAYCSIMHTIEAQDIANSGWNYTSASSYVTLSFWVKSSVTQTHLLTLHTNDSVTKEYNHLISLSANTWTKVEKTIPGHADIVMNNDTGTGLQIMMYGALGTGYTSGSTVDQWVTHSGYVSRPDMGQTWWETNNSTLEYTGVQLEVGEAATPFEHRSYNDDLAICQRYCYVAAHGASASVGLGVNYTSSQMISVMPFPVTMRTTPTLEASSGTNYYEFVRNGAADWFNSLTLDNRTTKHRGELYNGSEISGTAGDGGYIRTDNAAVVVTFTAEI